MLGSGLARRGRAEIGQKFDRSGQKWLRFFLVLINCGVNTLCAKSKDRLDNSFVCNLFRTNPQIKKSVMCKRSQPKKFSGAGLGVLGGSG